MIVEPAAESCCALQPLGNATCNFTLSERNTSRNSPATGGLKALANMALERNTFRNSRATEAMFSATVAPVVLQPVQHVPTLDPDSFAERAAIIEANGIPRAWAEGFATLCTMPRPSAYIPTRWQQLVDDGGYFLDRWGRNAAQLGWKASDVFGVNPDAPEYRYDCQGLVPLLSGRRVIAITADSARIDCGGGAHLTFYRKTMAAGAVALWEIEEQ